MAEWIFEVAVFGGKLMLVTLTLVVLLMGVGAAVMTQKLKKLKKKKHLQVEDMGGQLEAYRLQTQAVSMTSKEAKKKIKAFKKQLKHRRESKAPQGCVYVLDFKGDATASEIKNLRDEVSVLIKAAHPDKDEMVVRLSNSGGYVHKHGLGASQLQRLRDRGFKLTVCVDEVAGSGGYLMACVAHKIVAAPFAYIGSIGVIAQMPNFYRFLQKQNVDYGEYYAGRYKRTITAFGQITEDKKAKMHEILEDIHKHFKNYVSRYRPDMDMEKVATGEVWLGVQAKDLGLVDEISTSDDYILSAIDDGRKVYEFHLKSEEPKGLQKLLGKKSHLLESLRPVLRGLSHKLGLE